MNTTPCPPESQIADNGVKMKKKNPTTLKCYLVWLSGSSMQFCWSGGEVFHHDNFKSAFWVHVLIVLDFWVCSSIYVLDTSILRSFSCSAWCCCNDVLNSIWILSTFSITPLLPLPSNFFFQVFFTENSIFPFNLQNCMFTQNQVPLCSARFPLYKYVQNDYF